MSKLSECKKSKNELVKLKMILQAMEFSEVFECAVSRMSYEVWDETEGFVVINLDMNKEFMEE